MNNQRQSFGIALSCLLLLSLGSACSGKNINKDLTDDPSVMIRKWTVTTHGPFEAGDRGTEFSNPVFYQNTLVFGNRSIGLVSLYPLINAQRWQLSIPGGVVSEIAVDKNNGYFGGGDGFLYSVNLDNGRINWKYEVRNPVISRPTIAENRVFITTSDDVVYAFDAGTGKWLWHYRRRSAPVSTIYGAAAPMVDGNEVITGLSDGFLIALNLADGQLKWERKLHLGTKFTDVDAHPILDEGNLYVPSYDGSLYALKRAGGDTIWRFDSGGSKRVVIEGAKLFLPSTDGFIYALQKTNSKVIWKFQLDGGVPTNLVLTDKYVIVGSSYQYLYVIDKETGKGLYRFNVGSDSGFAGTPAYDSANRRLYALSHAGNLYSFMLRQPRRKQLAHGMTDPYKY